MPKMSFWISFVSYFYCLEWEKVALETRPPNGYPVSSFQITNAMDRSYFYLTVYARRHGFRKGPADDFWPAQMKSVSAFHFIATKPCYGVCVFLLISYRMASPIPLWELFLSKESGNTRRHPLPPPSFLEEATGSVSGYLYKYMKIALNLN